MTLEVHATVSTEPGLPAGALAWEMSQCLQRLMPFAKEETNTFLKKVTLSSEKNTNAEHGVHL